MFKLKCKALQYEWGQLGGESTVAQLMEAGQHTDAIEAGKPYAEFWMGVHPNGPSMIGEELLQDKLNVDNSLLGAHEEGTLQFLFKVQSVRKALSVQCHPTKEQAVQLHANDPKNYPDANQKPEMVIALTSFQLLCGFRPPNEIYANLKATPELIPILGELAGAVEVFVSGSPKCQDGVLKQIFTSIWSAPQEAISTAISAIINRIKPEPKNDLEKLMVRLDNEYPGGDVGVLAPLLLNYFTLKPGQATFLGPNRPHAYLLGDCIECMACSDNTIRAGLTPKYKDIATLCANLQYTMSGPPIFEEKSLREGVRIYDPPTPEFAVQEIKTSSGTLSDEGASSLLVVIGGSAKLSSPATSLDVHRGDVVFLSASENVTVNSGSADFLAFRAYTPKP